MTDVVSFSLTGDRAGEINGDHISSVLRRKDTLTQLSFEGDSEDETKRLQSHDMIELCQLLIQLPQLRTLCLGCKLVLFCGLSRCWTCFLFYFYEL